MKFDNEEDGSPGPERQSWARLAKDATLTGLATLWMTEEGIRNYLKELKLPKELVALLLEGFQKRKEDVVQGMGREVSQMLSKINVREEIQRFLQRHTMEVRAEIRFREKGNEDGTESD